jgi:hypothetical protein
VNDDGKAAYSNILAIRSDGNEPLLYAAYPNPFRDQLGLAFHSNLIEPLTYRILDMNGRQCVIGKRKAVKGLNTININGLETLIAGNYIIELTGSEKIMVASLMKHK